MARIRPLERDGLARFGELFTIRDTDMGFTSNSMLTMARWPELLECWMALGRVVMFAPSAIPQDLKALIAHVVSRTSGCRYCTAHSANHSVGKAGIPTDKLMRAFEYESSSLFTEAERAALRVAQAGGDASDDDFLELSRHFDERQIVEIVAVASFMSFLNRWNDTLAVELEDGPRTFAERNLGSAGWEVGKHGHPGENVASTEPGRSSEPAVVERSR